MIIVCQKAKLQRELIFSGKRTTVEKQPEGSPDHRQAPVQVNIEVGCVGRIGTLLRKGKLLKILKQNTADSLLPPFN